MATLVIYHDNCWDGLTGAWVIQQWARKEEILPTTSFLPMKHGQTPPDASDKDVILVDFSFKRGPMKKLMGQAKSTLVLDHHKTAQAELKSVKPGENDEIIFDMDRSGARIAWDHFFDPKEAPTLVKYVEDQDLWKFHLPLCRQIGAWISGQEMTLENLDRMVKLLDNPETLTRAMQEGTVILGYQDQLIRKGLEKALEVEIAGHKVLSVNLPIAALVSETGHRLSVDRPFGVCWFVNSEGKYVYSLRSEEGGEDVSAIAKSFGGGGHYHAAGFTSDKPPTEL